MNAGNRKGGLDPGEFSSIARKTPPSTELLQQRILAQTIQMRQQTPVRVNLSKSVKQGQMHRFGWRLLPVAGVAVLIFGVVIGFSSLMPKQPGVNQISGNEILFTAPDELAWQDVMLMHDELAFIGL